MKKVVLTAGALAALSLFIRLIADSFFAPRHSESVESSALPAPILKTKSDIWHKDSSITGPETTPPGFAPETKADGAKAPEQAVQAKGPEPRAERAEAEPLIKLKTLENILESKDDNDSRLDSDFNNLSPETKRLFRQEYRRMP